MRQIQQQGGRVLQALLRAALARQHLNGQLDVHLRRGDAPVLARLGRFFAFARCHRRGRGRSSRPRRSSSSSWRRRRVWSPARVYLGQADRYQRQQTQKFVGELAAALDDRPVQHGDELAEGRRLERDDRLLGFAAEIRVGVGARHGFALLRGARVQPQEHVPEVRRVTLARLLGHGLWLGARRRRRLFSADIQALLLVLLLIIVFLLSCVFRFDRYEVAGETLGQRYQQLDGVPADGGRGLRVNGDVVALPVGLFATVSHDVENVGPAAERRVDTDVQPGLRVVSRLDGFWRAT